METLLEAATILASPMNVVLLCAAVFGGIVIGAIPGLTSAVAIGLLIPFTFSFDAYSAFILLLGIYVGSMYGGSIPAILMNLPGTPTSAVTALDGYPMTSNGRAGEAIGISVFSGAIGGVISCLFMIFLSLQLARIALQFGGPEYFSLSLFAIVIVFALTADSLLKGAVAAGLGLLLGTIGVDEITPYPRFTFGISEIMIGIPLVPATIGLFCVAEAFRMIESEQMAEKVKSTTLTGIGAAARNLPRLWLTIARSSVIGTFVGVLPGAGATIGSYMSYVTTRAWSGNPDQFGKGEPEGVASSESANNAITGGAIIPLLTLGIPGDINTLLLIGAMFVHGLVPGPTLFTDQLALVYVIFGTLLLSSVLILIFGLTMTGIVAKAANIDKKYLIPVVLVISIAGPAISYGHIYYFWIAVTFGIVGYFCDKGGYPPLAIAMALILGPILEYNFRSSMMLPNFSYMAFLERPISLLFLVLTVLVLAYAARREWQRHKSAKSGTTAETAE